MAYEIYLDVVFCINFIMDLLVFWIAGRLARCKTTALRIALGSATAAALYCMLALFPTMRGYYNFFTTLAMLMIGLLIAFRPQKVAQMLKLVLYANISAFAVGGAAFAFFYYTSLGKYVGNALSFTVSNLSVKILLAAAASTYIALKLINTRVQKAMVKKQKICTVEIGAEDRRVTVDALLDTGNSLTDPLQKEPVVVAEFQWIKDLLPDEIKLIYYENKEDELLDLMNTFSKTSFIQRVRLLPFTSLGQQNGLLIGFKPDYITIVNMDGKDVQATDVIIGIYNHHLSGDSSYHALLNPELL